MPKRDRWLVVRDDDDEVLDDVEIAQARVINLSTDGMRVLETPRSPQKRFSRAVPTATTSFDHPPSLEDCDLSFDVDEEVAPETVGAKLAAKRYPTSVC